MSKRDLLQEARHEGELAAARELLRLGVDLTNRIEIFDIVMQERLWLFFERFDGPHGVFLPGGMLINSYRSMAIQRLTAAHEYGHHVLNHAMSVDDDQIVGDPKSIKEVREASAQAFAMDFLMPIPLVNFFRQKLGLSSRLQPIDVYELSLHLGTSYQATLFQLIAQEIIPSRSVERFIKPDPQEFKAAIGRGKRPKNSRADVWPLSKRDSGTTVHVSIDDELRLSLPESPATGYLWDFAHEVDDGVLDLVSSEFDVVDQQLVSSGTGGLGSRYINFRAIGSGKKSIHMRLRRSWAKNAKAAQEFTLGVAVAERHTRIPQCIQEALLAE